MGKYRSPLDVAQVRGRLSRRLWREPRCLSWRPHYKSVFVLANRRLFRLIHRGVAKFTHKGPSIVALSAKSDAANLSDITKQYFSAKETVQQKNSTKANIQHMLSFMHDDMQTEHKSHVSIECINDGNGKDQFLKGLNHYLGKYESSEIEIIDIREGVNMVSVKFNETIRSMRDDQLVIDHSKALYILEFEGDLISREFRYDLR
jgi:hypothetical protein